MMTGEATIALVVGLGLFMAWSALFAWKFTPYYERFIIAVPSAIAPLLGMAFAILVLLIIHTLICWLISIGFDSPVLNSAMFYMVSLLASVATFGFVFLLCIRYQRSWASSAGPKELESIQQDAVTEGEENQDKQKG